MLAMTKQWALAKVAQEVSLALTTQEIEIIAEIEEECLVESGRICFGEDASTLLIHALANSSHLGAGFENAMSGLIEAFYEIREETPAQISDSEIIEALCNGFEGEAAGDAGLARSLAKETFSAAIAHNPYEIADNEGQLYRWDPKEWHDDVEADGWYGEKWGEDYE